MENKDNNKAIIMFLMLAFALPLFSLILLKCTPFFKNGISYFMVYGFEAITPSISALLTIYIVYGKIQVLSFLKKSYIENRKIISIRLAFLLPFIIGILTYILCTVIFNISILNTDISIQKVVILLWSLVAEELGWRGFLQDRLNKKLDKKIIPLLIGIIWSLWHYHFFLLGTISTPIILFIASCIIDSYICYWLTNKSKQNIIPTSIYHFMGNFLLSVLLIYPDYHNGNILPYLLYIISSFIIMICFVKYISVDKRAF